MLSLAVVLSSTTLTACHDLYCSFIEGLTAQPLDCSHDPFPDLPDVPIPSLPPPPSLPTTTTTSVPGATSTTTPSATSTTRPDTTSTTRPDTTPTTVGSTATTLGRRPEAERRAREGRSPTVTRPAVSRARAQ